ncbi:MAG: glutaminyl-peptide cyclotransferase [Sphingobacteriales bacterium]|nr:MAG: glutaminyl-peptide cyclotransferase [Sphingobacteriales bacterium]
MKTSQSQFFILLAIALLISACKTNTKPTANTSNFTSPEAGLLLKAGETINIKLSLPDALVDSIQYFIDSVKVASLKDTTSLSLKTQNLPLGSRLITAKIFTKGISNDIATNIILTSAITPANLSYKITNTFKHDTASYTEGLEYHNGFLYESDGEYGASSMRKTTLAGKVIQKITLDKKYFGEGITLIGNKIIQLTYKEGIGFEYDKNTFKLLKTFPYNHTLEGWGLAFDGQTIYNTDGSNKIYKLNPTTYQSSGFIEVYDDKGPVAQLNELEWADGKLYANIYTSDLIAIINPKTGEVEAYISLITLPKGEIEDENNDVLNGIAYDAKTKRLFVTGKKWPNLFEIEVSK